jgi:hypothetical protein
MPFEQLPLDEPDWRDLDEICVWCKCAPCRCEEGDKDAPVV